MKPAFRWLGVINSPHFKPDYEKIESVGLPLPASSRKIVQTACTGFLRVQRLPALSFDELKRGLGQINKALLETARAMEELASTEGALLGPWHYLIEQAEENDKLVLSEIDAFFRIDTTLPDKMRSIAEFSRRPVSVPRPGRGRPELEAEKHFILSLYEAYTNAGGTGTFTTDDSTNEIKGQFASIVRELVRQMREKGYETGSLVETSIGRFIKEVFTKYKK